MENWRENLSIVSRLKVAGNQTDALAARLFFERLFTAANFHPSGISQRAVVCIKKIIAPPVDNKFHKFGGGNSALEWEIGIRREVEKSFRRAFRPIRETVPAQAESVIFEDEAEMLACLAQDWLRGVLIERWWWRALFPNLFRTPEPPVKIWLASAEFTPFALQILSKTAEAGKFVRKLQPSEAFELLRGIVRLFGLDKLSAALFEPPAKKMRAKTVSAVKPAGKSRFRADDYLKAAAKSDAFFALLIPELKPSDLSFEQQCLLETGLLLARSPRAARSIEFAERVRIRRVKNEFSKHLTSQKSVPVLEKDKALEERFGSRKKTTRQLPDERETLKTSPPPAKGKPAVFVAESGKKREKPSEKPTVGLRKTTEPAHEPANGFSENVESAPPEQSFQKLEQKTPKSAKKTLKPASAEQIFEDFFKDLETEVEFGFRTRFGGVFYLLNLGLYLGLYRDFTESLTTEIDLNIWDFVALLGLEFLGEEIKSDAIWDFLKLAAEREDEREFGREFKRFQDWRMPVDWLETFSKNQEWRWAKNKKRLVVRHAEGFNVIDVPARGAAERQLEKELEIYQNNFSRLIEAERKDLPHLKSKNWLKNLAEYLQKRLFQALNLQTPEELNAILFERRATVSVTASHLEITFALADLPIEVRLAGIDRNPAWIPAAGKFVYFHFV